MKPKDAKPLRVGKVQFEIMKVLWEKGSATAREITDALNEQAPIAHSTVQTLLRNLLAKGAVSHEKLNRTFIFKPVAVKDEVLTSTTQDLLSRVFQGSAYNLVFHLLQEEKISKEELLRLKQLVDEHAGEETK
jgi:BlaI family transcriptional regulator, penicillinase repressor